MLLAGNFASAVERLFDWRDGGAAPDFEMKIYSSLNRSKFFLMRFRFRFSSFFFALGGKRPNQNR